MKRRTLFPIVVLTLLGLLLVACAPIPAAAPQADAQPETAAMEDDPTTPLDPPAKVTVAYVPIMKFAHHVRSRGTRSV